MPCIYCFVDAYIDFIILISCSCFYCSYLFYCFHFFHRSSYLRPDACLSCAFLTGSMIIRQHLHSGVDQFLVLSMLVSTESSAACLYLTPCFVFTEILHLLSRCGTCSENFETECAISILLTMFQICSFFPNVYGKYQ